MNPKFAAVKNHFTNWREWELNPIVIKELRQAVRSWAVTGMLLLFLTVLFITSLVFLVGQSFNVHENTELGGTMFQAFAVILAGASILFIPLYIGVRVGAERVESNTDLLFEGCDVACARLLALRKAASAAATVLQRIDASKAAEAAGKLIALSGPQRSGAP